MFGGDIIYTGEDHRSKLFCVADGTWRYGRNGFLFLRRLWNSSEDVRKDSKMGLADTAISI